MGHQTVPNTPGGRGPESTLLGTYRLIGQTYCLVIMRCGFANPDNLETVNWWQACPWLACPWLACPWQACLWLGLPT